MDDRNESHPAHFPSSVALVPSFGRGRKHQRGRFSQLDWSNIGGGKGLEDEEQGPGEELSSWVMANVGW